MKNRINKAWIMALVVCFASCADLEEKPVGLLSPESLFRTPNDVEVVIFGAYGWISTERLYGRQFVSALMLRGDMVDIGDRGTPAERQQVNDFNMDADNGMVRQFWPYWYQTISAANAAVAGAETLDLSDEEINPLIAEARFIRAFSYYHLVRVFGDIPYIDFFITDPSIVQDISKTPVSEVYSGIIEDLEYAKQWLPDIHDGGIRSRATKGTAASYLASVYLTLEDYQSAYDEAKWVIDNKDLFGYGLTADFQDLFRAEQQDNLNEPIFVMDFLGLQGGSGGADDDIMGPMTGVRGGDQLGWSVLVPSMEVYNTWDDRDYRKEVSFEDSISEAGVLVPYTEFDNTQRPHIAKYARYPGNASGDTRNSDNNYAAMRYAEVLLIAAEALAEISGPNAEAIGYVNQIRERARNWAGVVSSFPEDVTAGISQADFIDLVLDERRLELAFEYKRWYDIKRRRLGEEVFTGPSSLEPHPSFDPNRDYLMPLPQVDLAVNPNLRPQNPGY
ncbi:RagB/SusD family nutrient uptake outer membrane protein [Catalinimonas niigatensis]|uniref:RagB/SusD family nutrient uptake outer membrane protein n=1 Tax=Catalinimonas niigatensis TaxID=1397264 RepID=UPI002664F892|nr:RagB/SusD family nutrient uptake outer membrane protein [Catalinimonas niigatensis]WPP50960.1 RagB/SusD family nutrient uptake outer membrane protein [Catalinimonas niigatensis]